MNKFFGPVGYVIETETAPDVTTQIPSEVNYFGDILKNTNRFRPAEDLNDELTISNIISIVADAFAFQNCHAMRYIKWMGAYWKITNVEVQRPRLILTIGGAYNGLKVETQSDPEVPSGDV